MNNANLFESFGKTGKPEWGKAASAEVNGENPFEKLTWETEDNQKFEPYYSSDDLAAISYLRNFRLNGFDHQATDARTWLNMPPVHLTGEEDANAIALGHLHSEAEGILFLSKSKKIDFGKLMNNISWEHCAVSFVVSQNFPLTDLINYISEKNYSYGKLHGAVYWDEQVVLPPALPSLNGFRLAGIMVPEDTPVNQVSKAISLGVRTIETFVQEGYRVNEIGKHIAFSVPVGPQLLIEIAKLKALRMLWFQVARAYGLNEYVPGDLVIHARSGKWIKEQFQPHGNLLKGTMAAMAAISGGADAITIEPEEDGHAMMNRIARNTSVILREEAQFGKVTDPFAGAYGIEVLTDRIARDAWQKFQSEQK